MGKHDDDRNIVEIWLVEEGEHKITRKMTRADWYKLLKYIEINIPSVE